MYRALIPGVAAATAGENDCGNGGGTTCRRGIFHAIDTSNVADYTGLYNLILALEPFLLSPVHFASHSSSSSSSSSSSRSCSSGDKSSARVLTVEVSQQQ